MLVIKPDECIGLRRVRARVPGRGVSSRYRPAATKWVDVNTKFRRVLAQHHPQGEAPADADA